MTEGISRVRRRRERRGRYVEGIASRPGEVGNLHRTSSTREACYKLYKIA